MTSYNAQTALEVIHHRQQQTRDEYARQVSSGTSGAIAALAVFAAGASVDLPSPWSLVAKLVAGCLIVGALALHYRNARVRRKTSFTETLFTLLLAAGVMAIFIVATISAHLIHLPIPSVPAAAIAALATVAATYATRPIIKRITNRDDQG
ncbi:hypothetical protein ADL22_27335 [Streptomyces sp. NRRL F-4489]|uniref:hypothetical protein n=1 Tax=Streptomyces sp. NRRL F-4489 TaxID=1609095 RepID=UPI00074A65C9|nr:hypothetical protein [Streptomyces sp. NRRL F-4489]KUL35417.1 hypothetical protein ADL22_27335 [Streptomyces sp. NRRL F-4489]